MADVSFQSEDYSDYADSDSEFEATPVKAAPAKKAGKKTQARKVADEESADGSVQSPLDKLVARLSASAKKSGKKSVEETYQKLEQIDHIKLRPDSYIGSVEAIEEETWVWDCDDVKKPSQGKMVCRKINYVPGLYKIFDEILVNASDNKQRDKTMDMLRVDIDVENNEISVWNNGRGVPIQMHREYNVWVPELIFGHLLTSSNYDDKQKKVTGGRNGYGAKLTNIFSSTFTVETCDSLPGQPGRIYKQVHEANMSKINEPKITKAPKSAKSYTKITFRPDLKMFGMETLDKDAVGLMMKRVFDIAGCNPTVKVYLQEGDKGGKALPVRTFQDYCKLYVKDKVDSSGAPISTVFYNPDADIIKDFTAQLKARDAAERKLASVEKKVEKLQVKADDGDPEAQDKIKAMQKELKAAQAAVDKAPDVDEEAMEKELSKTKSKGRWEICVALSDTDQFQQVSFVNSICTIKGGTHVNYIADTLVKQLVPHVAKKAKGAKIKNFQIKNQMFVFVRSLIENPAFDSQTKDTLTTKLTQFGTRCEMDDGFVKKVASSGIAQKASEFVRFKAQQGLKKTSGVKKIRLTGIPKLDDANEAGGRNGHKCTLILTEGDSAKAFAMSGLGVVGRDHYGVFPLRGKMLNVREASPKQLQENAELNYLKQILGIKHGVKYETPEDVRKLRYGHLMIMTDQDHDGSHIKGLLINFIHYFWPGLLHVPGFMIEFVTPIVRVTKGKQSLDFFTVPEYESWKESHNGGKGWKAKYYKGLGTSSATDAKKYFSDLDKHQIGFRYDGEADDTAINLAFAKKEVEARKDWLRNLTDDTFIDHSKSEFSYNEFVHKELILFSMADCQRSIPSMMDGMKPGQRKVLYSCFKRNLKSEIRVAQLAGYVSEHSAYHHGETSLQSTIVNMAQNFVGSNNINLLSPNGQFGTRLQGGKDAASARYIYTCLMPIARAIFKTLDEPLLDYVDDDGLPVEPEFYAPVLPMVLVNGADGIGTGWSTYVTNHNPRDITAAIRALLADEEPQQILPWYRDYKGSILPDEKRENYFEVRGSWEEGDDGFSVRIKELPVGQWTQTYKEFLESMLEKQKISDYKEHHTEALVDFEVVLTEQQRKAIDTKGIEKFFKLVSSKSAANMHLFDANGRIQKYTTALEILQAYYPVRLDLYAKRKDFMLDQLNGEWEKLDNKVRFILAVINEELVLRNTKKEVLLKKLVEMGFKGIPKQSANANKKTKKESGVVVAGDEDALAAGSDEEDENAMVGDIDPKDYEYLLGMPLWSLTHEKVEKLKKEKAAKEAELEVLMSKSARDLWSDDLDEFEEALDDFESKLSSTKKEQAKIKATPKGKGKKGGRKPRRKLSAKSMDSDSDDDFGGDTDDDDDFMPAGGKKKGAGSKRVSPTKAKGPTRKRAAKTKPAPAKEEAEDKDDSAMDVVSSGGGGSGSGSGSAAAKKSTAAAAKKPLQQANLLKSAFDSDDEDDMSLASLGDKVAKKGAASPFKADQTSPMASNKKKQAAASTATTTKGGAKPKPKAKAKPAPKKVVELSDSESEADISDDDDDGEDEFSFSDGDDSPAPAPRARPGRRAAAAASKKVDYAAMMDSDDDDDF